ncbi:hypothetical protein ACVLD2_002343 [Paenibacillus sp. PvR052]|nr:hypothetical protein [Paenibacillus sp. PvP091]MBP1171779.1 hypothetical protein [Paenibacillus sp. PvR098]MBP2438160.1 hypothetical protein [Paenibacillus sp. PvP052]
MLNYGRRQAVDGNGTGGFLLEAMSVLCNAD